MERLHIGKLKTMFLTPAEELTRCPKIRLPRIHVPNVIGEESGESLFAFDSKIGN